MEARVDLAGESSATVGADAAAVDFLARPRPRPLGAGVAAGDSNTSSSSSRVTVALKENKKRLVISTKNP